MKQFYPTPGFHFSVSFALPFPSGDVLFRDVSGLSVTLDTEDVIEGGENRFVHKLPVRTKYSELTLKRGLFKNSLLIQWCRKAIEDFIFLPTDISIMLLNEKHSYIMKWNVVHAYPTHWSVSDFSAMENSIVVETLKFNYQYFTVMSS